MSTDRVRPSGAAPPPERPGELDAASLLDAATGRLTRRSLLGAGAMAGLGLAVSACTSDDADAESGATAGAPTASAPSGVTTDFDPSDWVSVREQFGYDPDIAQFAAFVFASHPAPVSAAIERHREGLDFNPEGYLNKRDRERDARLAAASYLDVPWQQIALTDSTTMGLGVLYSGLKLAEGDEILTTTHDFYSTTEALRLAALRSGAKVVPVTLYDTPAAADHDQIIDRLRAGITAKTRVVAITWVHSGTGVRLPVSDIAAAVEKANTHRADADRILLGVDGVHGFGLVDQTAADLGCDFLAAGTHKWLFGPRGTGLLWGRAWDRFEPTIPTFSAPHNAPGPYATPGGFHSFEHRWAVKEAFEFREAIGSKQVEERTVSQATQLKEGLAALSTVTVQTPMSPDLSAGIVCLSHDTVQPWDAVPMMYETSKVAASVTPYNEPFLRLGPSIITNPDEVDRAIAAVAALA